LKPVKAGHCLVSSKRVVERLIDLTDSETADLFNAAKKVQKMLESFYQTNSTTICVQDGLYSGQTVKVTFIILTVLYHLSERVNAI
jgi:diadenosine tetraphosphate (Ap4A) HIT family hydrolase